MGSKMLGRRLAGMRSLSSMPWRGRLQPRLLAKGLQPFAAITALGMHISTTSTHAFWGGKAAEGAAKPGTKDAIVTTASGLQYVDHVVGTGDKPRLAGSCRCTTWAPCWLQARNLTRRATPNAARSNLLWDRGASSRAGKKGS